MIDKLSSSPISRTAFLKGQWKKGQGAFRPPWALQEASFIENCDSSCSKCVDDCPEKIIVLGRGRLPQIDFSKGECIFCEECLKACQYNALIKKVDVEPFRHKAIIILSKCLTYHKTVCRVCGEVCDTQAIKFTTVSGDVPQPDLKSDKCTGCGACFHICPTDAIGIQLT